MALLFKICCFEKDLSAMPSECQTVWIQIRPDFLSGLIWVQTVCKDYQQMTKVATSGVRPNTLNWHRVDVYHKVGSAQMFSVCFMCEDE